MNVLRGCPVQKIETRPILGLLGAFLVVADNSSSYKSSCLTNHEHGLLPFVYHNRFSVNPAAESRAGRRAQDSDC
jgi:predicted GNAT superfamily acetyltransferase